MTLTDMRGAPVSTGNRKSLDGLERAFNLFQGFYLDPLAEIDAVLAEDPDFIMGHCFRAGLFVVSSDKQAEPEIAATVARVEKLAGKANERERGHLAAAKAWLAGDFHGAADCYGVVIANCPRDAVALHFAHQCDFLLGQSRMLRDRISWALPHYDEKVQGYGYLLGMRAFGLEEMGEYAKAEAAGRKALSIEVRDPWAVHAVAHVMEMEGRAEDGIEWLTSREHEWAPNNGFAFHNAWHLALFHLDRRNFAETLRIYDQAIHPKPTTAAMELVDAVALLWRLQLLGQDVGTRWRELADTYEPMAEDGYYAFNDMHAMLSFVADGREAAAGRLLRRLKQRAEDSDSNGVVTREVGLPIVRALFAFDKGDYDRAVELLLPVRLIANRFGGSHAQRDVVDVTLVEAAIRGGRRGLATALSHERLLRKPESPWAKILLTRASMTAPSRSAA